MSSSSTSASYAIFSVDFEARGPDYVSNGANGVGIVVFDSDGKELESYETGISLVQGQEMNADTKKYFWDKNPESLKWLSEHEKEPKVVVQDVVDLYAKYKKSHGKVVWVAWPASYDWGHMTYLFETYKAENAPSIGFSTPCASTMYRIYCATHGIPRAKEECASLGFPIENPHFPASDARAQGLAFIKMSKEFGVSF